MVLESEIRSMYLEIDDYDGNFGDPIVTSFSFDPWNYLQSEQLSLHERRGVIVALLVNLMSSIDNSTYADARASREGRRAIALLESDVVEEFSHLKAALVGFSESEEAFCVALRAIYSEWVQPTIGLG